MTDTLADGLDRNDSLHDPWEQQPRITLLSAITRHWVLFGVCAVACTVAGIAFGIARSPSYRAESRLTTGQINVITPGAIGGYASASEVLAGTYSRAIDASDVVAPIAEEMRLSQKVVRRRLQASPFPESPVIRVEASGPSEAAAVQLANLGAGSLRDYVKRLNGDAGTKRAYTEFRDAADRVATARQLTADRQRDYGKDRSAARRIALVNARSEQAQAEAVFESRREAYQDAVGQEATRPVPQLLQPAASADSDRMRMLQLFAFAGLVAGVAFGLVLAAWRASRLLRRTYAAG